ncbi:uncharacterized protein LOC143869754 [Tasmannia lanceolata]|uniref:uncharacterized protein LOC143869754 n=1 Tax=Tasmannia lanceolata TaxID=3420 RepID=UPI004063FB27
MKVENEISFPDDDALVITMLVANWELKKILVDNRSFADILYYHAFKQTMIGNDHLKPVNSDLFEFFGEIVKGGGQIELPVLVGEPPHQAFTMVNFLLVRATSAYNAILGRPGQNLASAYRQNMKFVTLNGVGEVKGDQTQSRECYATALKGKNASEALPIELLDLRDETQVTVNEPTEDLVSILLYEDNEEKLVRIGSSLSDSVRQELIQFLRRNADVFTWTPANMPGIDPEEIKYTDWLTNVVMVKKANGKWRICIDFTVLNKACPKDSYPLPKINQLIDATLGHKLLSFMDAFSG